MQDPNLVDRPPDDRGPTVAGKNGGGRGPGGWAAAVIIAVLVVVGIFYFAGSGTQMRDGAGPNANTPATSTTDTAPAGGATGAQPLENQPNGGQTEGNGATTVTP